MSLDDTIHSFLGASKLSADIITQEFGKNLNLFFQIKIMCAWAKEKRLRILLVWGKNEFH